MQTIPGHAIGYVAPNPLRYCSLLNRVQVVYASINITTAPERVDADGNVISPKQSVTTTQPIGTIRLVPFPHPPHPEPGGSYAADALETAPNPSAEVEYIVDRATTYHDGKEAYVKLGRLAVIKEFRGAGISKLLVSAAMTWAQQNPAYFTPSIKTMGMEKMGALLLDEIPLWKGLICVHAQEYLVKAWEKWGFKVDEEMGTWKEEGIKHVGMFQRLNIEKQEPSGQI